MSLIEAVVLGLVQGLTEFWPISSTAHLWIVRRSPAIDARGQRTDQRARAAPTRLRYGREASAWHGAAPLLLVVQSRRLVVFAAEVPFTREPASAQRALRGSSGSSTGASPVAMLAELAGEAGVSFGLDGKRFRSAYLRDRSLARTVGH